MLGRELNLLAPAFRRWNEQQAEMDEADAAFAAQWFCLCGKWNDGESAVCECGEVRADDE